MVDRPLVDQRVVDNPYAEGFASAEEYRIARERGRRMAAEVVRLNPKQKAKVEKMFGVDRCRQLWPEAYE